MSPGGFRDTVSNVKSRKLGIKICPRCGSIDVDATTGTGYVSPPLYVCNRCNFSGSIFPEVESIEELKNLKPSEASEENEAEEGSPRTDEKDDREDTEKD